MPLILKKVDSNWCSSNVTGLLRHCKNWFSDVSEAFDENIRP